MLQLRIIKGPSGIGREFTIEPGRPTLVGRGDECAIQLPGNGISKRHCRLSVLPGSRLEVEDVGSSNGTFVNGLLVKKHVLKAGDILALNPFMLQVEVVAPKNISAATAVAPAFDSPTTPQYDPNSGAIPAVPQTTGQKVGKFLDGTMYPLADRLSGQFDIRLLCLVAFVIWSILVVVFTASPFASKANEKVVDQAVEVARLYARQLARINNQAIIDQRYTDLVSELDVRTGQTPGIVRSIIIDATKAQILAPADVMGQPLNDKFERLAIAAKGEYVQFDGDGYAYVSVPIKVGTSNGNIVSAIAYVQMDTLPARFTAAAILEQALNSVLLALLASFLLLVFIYRWLEGSLQIVAARIDDAMKRSETTVTSPVLWPAMSQLCEQVSSALGRSGGGGSDFVTAGSTQWAISSTQTSGTPAAAFDSSLVVIGWNARMERLIGVRANTALGGDISGASRDVAFETNVREMAAESAGAPWTPFVRDLDFSGSPYKMAMVFGDGAHLLSIVKVED